jgi:TPR repeat protein
LKEASKILKMSADQGLVSGQVSQSVLRFQDMGSSIDYVGAAKYLKAATDSGGSYGKVCHRICLVEGKGAEVDVAQAVEYCGCSANQQNLNE